MSRLFAAFALAWTVLSAPVGAQEYGVPLQVSAGEQYTVAVDMSETIVIGGGDEITVGATSVYQLDILSHGPDGGVWRYTPVSFGYSDLSVFGAELEDSGMDFEMLTDGVSAMMRVVADIGFECRVDQFGQCVEWSNWPQWSARVENLALMGDAFARMAMLFSEDMSEEMAVEEAPAHAQGKAAGGQAAAIVDEPANEETSFNWEEVRQPVLQSVAALLDGVDSQSAAIALAGFHPAASVQGRTMTRGVPQAFAESWTMPFEAPPLLVEGTLVLSEVDRRAGVATFTRNAAMDQESARASLEGGATYIINTVLAPVQPLLEEQGANQNLLLGLVQAMLPQLDLSLTETTTGLVDLQTGMARETRTDWLLVMNGPGSEEAPDTTIRLRYVMNITPGAPETPRLPRAP